VARLAGDRQRNERDHGGLQAADRSAARKLARYLLAAGMTLALLLSDRLDAQQVIFRECGEATRHE
jgi:hypothetical protein